MDSDFMNNLANMMKNGNIPDDLKNVINSFNHSSSNNADNSSNTDNTSNSNDDNAYESFNFNNSGIDLNMLLKIKSIMDKMNNNKDDPRSNLLMSLKPYLKESRRNKLNQYVQLFNMSKIIEAFNDNGGEDIK